MTLDGSVLAVFSIVKLVFIAWLFSPGLPMREPRGARVASALAPVAVLTATGVKAGFSLFPTLTDDLSFFIALLTFGAVLGVAVLAHAWVYLCSPLTSLFCCSMAYMLDNLTSAVDRMAGGLVVYSSYPPPILESGALYWAISAAVIALAYTLLIRRVKSMGLLLISNPVMVVATILTMLVCMVLDLAIKDVNVLGIPARYQVVFDWAYVALCVYILYSTFEIVYNRKLRANLAAMEHLRAIEAKQYEMSRANIEAINIKCHDLKHQIRALATGGAAVNGRVLDDISREVDVYDAVVKSGNDALDTILTEKSLYCEKHGITLSCIADGAALDFAKPADLYSFFGNALDNAIEAVERLDDAERRSIGLVVRRTGDMVSIHVENYFDGRVEFSGEGLPRTRKGDEINHGYGVRSMRAIVEAAGGSLTCRAEGDVFHLDALIPIPA